LAQRDISGFYCLGRHHILTPSDANLTGAFFANGNFVGGTTGAQTDKQLVIYGSVAGDAELNGVGKVSSQRDLGVGNAIPEWLSSGTPSSSSTLLNHSPTR